MSSPTADTATRTSSTRASPRIDSSDFDALDRALRDAAADLSLDDDERFELREIGRHVDPERLRYLRNRAFAIAREVMGTSPARALDALRWLEQVVKTLDAVALPAPSVARACFAPGDDCLRTLRDLCRAAKTTLDVCVFTISDDRLSAEILACHRRGVAVRVLTDDDKQHDLGSDIATLRDASVPVRVDRSPNHMHHKFALFDGRLLANGSYNRTRSATMVNEENLVVSDDLRLVRSFMGRFEALWERFAQDAAS